VVLGLVWLFLSDVDFFLLINARHLTDGSPTLNFRSEASSPALRQIPAVRGLDSMRRIAAERRFWL